MSGVPFQGVLLGDQRDLCGVGALEQPSFPKHFRPISQALTVRGRRQLSVEGGIWHTLQQRKRDRDRDRDKGRQREKEKLLSWPHGQAWGHVLETEAESQLEDGDINAPASPSLLRTAGDTQDSAVDRAWLRAGATEERAVILTATPPNQMALPPPQKWQDAFGSRPETTQSVELIFEPRLPS